MKTTTDHTFDKIQTPEQLLTFLKNCTLRQFGEFKKKGDLSLIHADGADLLIRRFPESYPLLPTELKNKKRSLDALEKRYWLIPFIPQEFLTKEKCLEIAHILPGIIPFIPKSMKDEDFYIQLINNNKPKEIFIPRDEMEKQMLSDEVTCDNVQRYYHYIPEEDLTQHLKECLVKITPGVLQHFLIKDLTISPEVYQAAFEKDKHLFKDTPKELQNFDMCVMAVKADIRNHTHVISSIKQNPMYQFFTRIIQNLKKWDIPLSPKQVKRLYLLDTIQVNMSTKKDNYMYNLTWNPEKEVLMCIPLKQIKKISPWSNDQQEKRKTKLHL